MDEERGFVLELVATVNQLHAWGVDVRSFGVSPESFERVWLELASNFGIVDREGASKANHIWVCGILFYRHPTGTTPSNSVSVVQGGNVCCDKCGRRQGVARFISKTDIQVLCPDCGPYLSWVREEQP